MPMGRPVIPDEALLYLIVTHTSRKPCEKKPQSFSHCGSFDHPDLQSLNDYKKNYFHFATANLNVLGHVIYRWKGVMKTFPTVYYKLQNT